VSLNNVGRVEGELGRWEAAGAAYRESLAIARRLLDLLGETPQTLDDVGISLENVARCEQALGQTIAARAALEEALQLFERASRLAPDSKRLEKSVGRARTGLAALER
jgi:tetratricopeptide (TPR) repeat protein